MDLILSFLGGLSPILQVILLVILVIIFKDDIVKFFRSKLGGKEEDSEVSEETTDWRELLFGQMQELSLHFNHQTTEGQARLEEKLDKSLMHQEKLVHTLQEFKEYGMKCRKE